MDSVSLTFSITLCCPLQFRDTKHSDEKVESNYISLNRQTKVQELRDMVESVVIPNVCAHFSVSHQMFHMKKCFHNLNQC